MLKKIHHLWYENQKNRQNLPALCLIGAPDDQGIRNVGGRLGANQGPDVIRKTLEGFMLGSYGELNMVYLDRGFDVKPSHDELRKAVSQSLKKRIHPIVLGGGHDYGYPHIAGAADFFGNNVALINVDAHFDVRPVGPEGITSGSPFFLALENKVINPKNFVEFGIQEHCNDISFTKYLEKKKVSIIYLDELQKSNSIKTFSSLLKAFSKKKQKIVVSFDVDSVAQSFAPGVSAPQAEGFTSAEFLAMARLSGECPDVVTVGFFEFSPPLDHDGKTARLVATAIHRYASGFSRRGGI